MADDSEALPTQGPLSIFFAVVIGVALIGFMRATSSSSLDHDFQAPVHGTAVASVSDEVPSARSYRELRNTPRGDGSGFTGDLESLRDNLPSHIDMIVLGGTDEDADLAARAARWAYDGAPPIIPHPVRQSSASECYACHQEGVKLAAHQASTIPHGSFQVCTQCHAMAAPNLPWGDQSEGLDDDPREVANNFVGMPASTKGPRWNSISPPQIPHKTFMRERCGSCHGVAGRNAIRSSHPYRQSCEQCHAPQAEVEWRPGGLK